MKKKLVVFGVISVLIVFSSIILFQTSKSRTFQFFGEIYPRVETTEKVAALTFDDGPNIEQTDEILGILREENVKATFFLIGADIEKNKGATEKIIAEGHEIGNHSFSHNRMVLVSPGFVKNEIEKTDELIRNSGYQGEILFRPPYGKKLFTLPFYLSQNKRKSITWDVEPETYSDKSDEMIAHTLENTKNGSIILLHVMYNSRKESMKSVRPIIRRLREKGFSFVTVSKLLTLKTKNTESF